MIGSDNKSVAQRNSGEVLRLVGISPIFHRVQITDMALQRQQHVSAEEVYEQLQFGSRPVSRATSYKTLNILVNHGRLWKDISETSRVFYDSYFSSHHDFFGTDTEELADIEAEQLEILGMSGAPPCKSVAGMDSVIQLKSID